MKPPYVLNTTIIKRLTSISELLGALRATHLDRPSPELRKSNKIKTIHSSLGIEGNTLSLDQVTAILENRRVLGPSKDILEVSNAIEVYGQLRKFNAFSEKSLLKAHQLMMTDLIESPGRYRSKSVGIVDKSKIRLLAPPAGRIPVLMSQLFEYLRNYDELVLIKSCVFHYELEFIHPFLDGNGRIGRLWQTVLLMTANPVFEFLPFETIISQNQDHYYSSLAASDKSGQSTPFIEFMLSVIESALQDRHLESQTRLSTEERIEYFISQRISPFTRKDYMAVFKDISSSTASRDLRFGIENGSIVKTGEKNQTTYRINFDG